MNGSAGKNGFGGVLGSRSSTSTGSSIASQTASASLKWKMGLMNEAGKFLTAEPFGFKLNVSAVNVKKRQIWTIVPDSEHAEHIYLKSHLNRYLSTDKDGKVTCDSEDMDCEAKFYLEFNKNSTLGGWSFKSVEYGYFLTGNEDRIHCFSKTPAWWRPHLAVHPQVHLRNLNRQRYVRLQGDEIHGDQIIPWGYNSLITLAHYNGKVAVRTRDNRYLQSDGTLIAQLPAGDSTNALYNIEIRAGQNSGMAFQDNEGRYLTLIGSTGTMKSKNKTIGKDELFILEESYAQIAILAHNFKYASVRQGVDLYANQAEVEETETFQLEYQNNNDNNNQQSSSLWKIRTCSGKLWTIDPLTGGIKASGTENDKSAIFEMEYQDDGTVAFHGHNGQYVTSRKLGVVSATAGEQQVGKEEKFFLVLLNRPIMVFQSEFGLVGTRNGRVECNMVNYEAFQLEYVKEGQYTLKDSKGLYWNIGDGGALQLSSRATEAYLFTFRFHNRTQLSIRANNGKFLRGEQNGTIKADGDDCTVPACLWEF